MLEELDAPNEYFYNGTTLFYFHNGTGAPPPTALFESTELKQLLTVTGGGQGGSRARDIIIRGIEFRDTAYTYMDKHGMPSGGDWCLQRSGALRFENTENVLVDGVKISRCDGNGRVWVRVRVRG